MKKLMLLLIVLLGAFQPVLAAEDITDPFITFTLPDDWVVCQCDPADNILDIASDQAALETPFETLESGLKVRLIKSTYRLERGEHVELDPAEVIQGIIDTSPENMPHEDHTPLDLDGREAVRSNFQYEDTIQGILIGVPLSNGDVSIVIGFAPLAEFEELETQVLTIAASVQVTIHHEALVVERELSEEFANAANSFTFTYPQPWQITERGGLVYITSKEEVLSRSGLNGLLPGDLIAVIYPRLIDNSDYTEPTGNEVPSTIVAFYASMGYALGYTQQGEIDVFESEDGREVSAGFAVNDYHDFLVIAIEDSQGDITTMLAYTAPGEMSLYRQTLLDLLQSSASQSGEGM